MKFALKSRPNIGDCRRRLKFAWTPTVATNIEKVGVPTKYWVWLETIEVYEEYKKDIEATDVGARFVEHWVIREQHIKE